MPGDLVYTKTFLTDLGKAADYTRAFVEALGDVRPVSTLLGVPALVRPELLVEIEAEAVLGAAALAPRHLHAAHAGEAARLRARRRRGRPGVRQRLHVGVVHRRGAGAGRLGPPVRPGDRHHRWALEQAGASLDDVVRRRTFTVEGAKQNRAYGDGPTPFAKSHPASLGCRISGLARPELVVEVEVTAVKGAGAEHSVDRARRRRSAGRGLELGTLRAGGRSRIDTVVTIPAGSGPTMGLRRDAMRWVRWMGATLVVAMSLLGGREESEAVNLQIGQPAPEITGGRWINSEPLSLAGLRGRVVLVEFWTYG